jgi:hypothetical protein
MKPKYFRIIISILAFVCFLENRMQAAVESLGDSVTVEIPNDWSITTRDASMFIARSPSGSITLSVRRLANTEKKITVKDYDTLNLLLKSLLNSEELATIKSFNDAGYPLTSLATDAPFSGGAQSDYMFYSANVIRALSITDFKNYFSVVSQHIFLTDGTNSFLVKLLIFLDSATQDEISQSAETIGSFTSEKISSPLDDDDADGVSNFNEVILYGTDPNSKDIPQGPTYQGPTITSDLSSVSVPISQNIIPYAVTTNFGANAFTATGLPKGLKIDAMTGVISGMPSKKGTYTVRVTASKKQGKVVADSVTTSKSLIVY